MDRPDDLDLKRAEILAMFKHGDGDDYWRAVHAVGSLVAELVALRGFRDASLAYLRGHIDDLIEESCVVAADNIERLRVTNADLRIMVDGLETAAHEERTAVVAWLTRTHGWTCDDCGFNIADLADAIERGEHRRKEGT